MKYVKMLGLLAVAAAAMMAFAGLASATIVTSPAGKTYTGKIQATAGVTTLHGATTITCNKSSVEGELKEHTGTGATTARGPLTSLKFEECIDGNHVKVLKPGSLEIHKDVNTGDGILTSSGAEVEITVTSIGVKCIYSTNNTPVGTLTGSNTTKGKAVLDVHGTIQRTGGSFFCGSSGTWTGQYTVNTPSTLEVH